MIYGLLAPVYDEINKDIDYKKWADFTEDLAKKCIGHKPELVLDLACGTGSMTLELAKRGYDMIGIDYSPDMLNVARERAELLGISNVLWLCQDMRDFELYGTVGMIVSTLDSINHLTDEDELLRCFSLAHNYLDPDGAFIFDINGKKKFESTYGNQSYVMETENAFCVWQNDYDKSTCLCNFYITLFSELSDGAYERYDEDQTERMYLIENIKNALVKMGFEFIGAYADFEKTPASDEDDRIYIVAKCKK